LEELILKLNIIFFATLVLIAIFGIKWWSASDESRAKSLARLNRSIETEVIPIDKIALFGDVKLHEIGVRHEIILPKTTKGASSKAKNITSCNSLCAALLMTPGIKSVTITDLEYYKHKDQSYRTSDAGTTYRLDQKNHCRNTTRRPTGAEYITLKNRNASSASGNHDARSVTGGLIPNYWTSADNAWNILLASNFCLSYSEPLNKFDFTIAESAYENYIENGANKDVERWRWSTEPLSVRAYNVKITNRNNDKLFSWTSASTAALSKPKHIFFFQTGYFEFVWGWGRETFRNKWTHEWERLPWLIAKHTTLREGPYIKEPLPLMRELIVKAVSDKSLSMDDPAFDLIDPWLWSITRQPIVSEDQDLVISLINDERIIGFNSMWKVYDAMGTDALRLRDPINKRQARGQTKEEHMRPLLAQIDRMDSAAEDLLQVSTK
jgi:hypothetical protein